MIIGYVLIGGFALFIIIAGAVKMAVKEALYEFGEDFLTELKKINSNTSSNEM